MQLKTQFNNNQQQIKLPTRNWLLNKKPELKLYKLKLLQNKKNKNKSLLKKTRS